MDHDGFIHGVGGSMGRRFLILSVESKVCVPSDQIGIFSRHFGIVNDVLLLLWKLSEAIDVFCCV